MSLQSLCLLTICVIVTISAQSIVDNERRNYNSAVGFLHKSRQVKKSYMMSLYREKRETNYEGGQIASRTAVPKLKGRKSMSSRTHGKKEHSALMRSEIVRSFKSKACKKVDGTLVLFFDLLANMRSERIRLGQLVLPSGSLHSVSGILLKLRTTSNHKTVVVNIGPILMLDSSERQSPGQITLDVTNALRRWSNVHSKVIEEEKEGDDTDEAVLDDEGTMIVFTSMKDSEESNKRTKAQFRSRRESSAQRNDDRQRRRRQRNRRRNKTDYAKFDGQAATEETENLNAHGMGNELEDSEGVSYVEMQRNEDGKAIDETSEWEREQNARRIKVDVPTSRSMHRAAAHCRKVPFEVNFDKIGWGEWIIYPKRYQAFRCEGQCSFSLIQNQATTNHAFVQSIYSSSRPDLEIPTPCCVPTKLQPLSLLYFENGEVVQRDHQDLIVEECGCR